MTVCCYPFDMVDYRKPPTEDIRDTSVRISRAFATLVPGGAALMEFVTSPIEVRRQHWMEMMACDLSKLAQKVEGFSAKTLVENEAFVTAMLHASQAAIRTHQQEKHEALRNAVLNVAAERGPDDELQHVFLSYVDRFTPSHLRVLTVMRTPRHILDGVPPTSPDAYGGLLEGAIPELAGRSELYVPIWGDLQAAGLIEVGEQVYGANKPMWSNAKMVTAKTIALGDQFLDFITSPIDEDEG